MVRFLLIFGFLAGAALAQRPEPRTDPILEAARSWALHYARTLPDFFCNELIRRFANYQGPEVRVDTLTLQLGFNRQKETYRLVARDGRPTRQTIASLNGSFSSGEFGSALFLIFDPESAASFQPEPRERMRRRLVAVYSFAVTQARSRYKLQYGAEEAITAYHGRVYVDAAAGRVLRLTMAVDPPEGFPIRETSTVLDYDYRDIGGTRYLLPVHADVRTTERAREIPGLHLGRAIQQAVTMQYHNVVEFRDYHKYAIESKLAFEDPQP
jgi:hypothetical protein